MISNLEGKFKKEIVFGTDFQRSKILTSKTKIFQEDVGKIQTKPDVLILVGRFAGAGSKKENNQETFHPAFDA